MKRTLFSRLLSLTLCLVFLVGLVPVAFAADELNGNISGTTTITVGETTTLSVSGTTGSLKWTVSGNGSIEGSDTSSSVVVKGTAAGSVTVTVTETIPAAGETPETTKTGSTTITVNPPATTDVTGVTVTPSTASITVNGTVNLIAKVAPDNATNKTVVWTSSDNNVATVDSGIVTGKRAGTATITATTADGEKTSTCQVTVTAPVVTPPTLNITSSSLLVGGTITLSVNNPPSGATFNWSGNSNVTLGNNGGSSNTVTGRTVSSNNTVSVQVTSGGTTTTLNCTINVVNPYINPTSASLNVGQTVGLSVSNLPSNASVIWSRTNTTITNFSGSGTSITVSADRAGYSDYTATVTANGKSVTTATCRVTVNNTSSSTTASTINRTVKNSDVLTFSRSNFNDVKPSSAGTIDYIYFTDLPSSRGTLYYNYRESSGNYDHSISASSSSSYRYYYSPSGSQNDLSLISFVPKSGTGSTTLSYYAVTSGTNYSGSITITVEEGVNKVNFNVAKNNVLKLSSSDFNTACKNLNGSNLEYIEFDELPTSSQGTLYLNYSSSSGSGTSVKTGTRYYRSGTPSIDDISFVPKNNYTGTVTLAYSARDVNSKYFSGKLTIRVGTGSGDVSYSANAGTAVTFKIADFNTYCKDETGYNLDYVQFSLPSSSKGTLYYDYTSSSNYGSTVDTRTKYYYSGSSSKSYLSKVTFVPANNTTGTVTIDFTGLNDNGRSFSGTVSIDYTGTVSNPSTIYYSSAGAPITFNKSDFVTACSNRGGSPLSSVKFTLPA